MGVLGQRRCIHHRGTENTEKTKNARKSLVSRILRGTPIRRDQDGFGSLRGLFHHCGGCCGGAGCGAAALSGLGAWGLASALGACGLGGACVLGGARMRCNVLPSCRGRNSTIALSPRSLIKRSRIPRPKLWRVISRPRKKMVALTLSPSARKRSTWFFLVS